MHLLKHLRLTHRESDDADSAEAEPTITLAPRHTVDGVVGCSTLAAAPLLPYRSTTDTTAAHSGAALAETHLNEYHSGAQRRRSCCDVVEHNE